MVRPTLTLIDVASGSLREVAKDFDAWPNIGDWSADGKRLIVGADVAGHVPVFAIEVATGKIERITAEREGGAHSDLHVLSDGRIAGIRSTFLEPPEAFVVAREVEFAAANACAPFGVSNIPTGSRLKTLLRNRPTASMCSTSS